MVMGEGMARHKPPKKCICEERKDVLSGLMADVKAAFTLSCLQSHQRFGFYFYWNCCSSAHIIRVY